MALFRRNRTDDTAVLPEEVTSYYQAENRERSWMAWLLALVTLAATAIIIIALFFGGRWVYRKLRHSPSATTSVVTQKPAGTITTPTTTSNPSPSATTPNSTPNTSTTTPSSNYGSVNAPTNSSTSNSAPATTSTPTSNTSTTAPSGNTNLPNTGPGDIISIFAVVSITAYGLHRRLQRQ